VEQLYHSAPPAADVEHASRGSGVLADRRFVYLSALAPARMGSSVTPPKKVLTVEI
jgi:hypothetical protein